MDALRSSVGVLESGLRPCEGLREGIRRPGEGEEWREEGGLRGVEYLSRRGDLGADEAKPGSVVGFGGSEVVSESWLSD